MSARTRTTPKAFQQAAIESGLAIFSEAKRVLDAAPEDPAVRALAIGTHGILLIEAPTGAGKTLIAGHLVERFSAIECVVWFWFAPFKGVIGQTVAALRAEYPGLRLRELTEDRNAADSRDGDVWVTTWQTVATKVKDRRNVHRRSEGNLTVEELIEGVRAQGLRIGVVVDEAHHSFFGKGTATQAMEFYRTTLRPEYTALVTATPDDADVARFKKDLGLARLNPLRISRREPVEEGLIKEGIQCVAFLAPEEQKALVDFEATALREGAALHRKIKAELKTLGVQLVPLMLVQVDSTKDSAERAKQTLLRDGFTEDQIAVHTADEPDSGLLAIANDEQREVLIFKMAVALGFDAPRAGILVSMRAARDEDFGVQLVGRILRVHRKLQGRARAKTLPDLLRFGYVLLADSESQAGLDRAGQRINKLQTEYGAVSPTTVIVRTAGQDQVHLVNPSGQVQLFTLQVETTGGVGGFQPTAGAPAFGTSPATQPGTEPGSAPWHATIVELLTGGFSAVPTDSPSQESPMPSIQRAYTYALRADVPRRFKTQVISPDNDATESDCAQRFTVSSRHIIRALAAKIDVQTRKLEIFTQQLELGLAKASMDPEQAARAALRVLTRNETFDPRELRRELLKKLAATLREDGLTEIADDADQVGAMLNVILTTHPELLYDAQKAAVATHFEIEEAEDEIPSRLQSDTALNTSRLNVYRAEPQGMNSWETDFARLLDADMAGVVRWWHRNEPHKPWSVQVLLADGRGFFPDFVVGIEGRRCELGALLADPKFGFEVTQEHPKTYAEHPIYGRVLILSRSGGQWMTVRYNAAQQKPELGKEFRLADCAGY